MVVQNLHLPHIQTKSAKETLRRLGLLDQRCLIVYGEEVDLNFALSTRNIPEVDLMAAGGLNVYDVLKHPRLVLSRDALDHLDERFAAQTLWQVSDEDVWGDTVRSVPHKGSKPNWCPGWFRPRLKKCATPDSLGLEKRQESTAEGCHEETGCQSE
jgi:Ribosomal protein L4/L1 family